MDIPFEQIRDAAKALPREEREVLVDELMEQERKQIAATLKERAQGPSVPFDPSGDAFFNEVREEGGRMLNAGDV